MKNIMVNTFESIESRYKSKTNNSDFIETDFWAMDFHRGDLIVIAARPSIGKTAFALSLANQIALHKKRPVGYISLGCTEETLFGGHLLSINSGVPLAKIRSARFIVSDVEKLLKSAEILWESPIYLLGIELTSAESDTEPSLQDFKKYMIIPSMADMIILLNRSKEKEEEAQFHIAKNLNGWTGIVDLTYNPKTMSFKKGSDE